MRKLLNSLATKYRLITILSLIGPGIIATASGNDAGGIATYSIAGAHYGLSLLWIMFPLTFAFMLVQEMSLRLGAATGKGFSDLIRENFDIRSTIFMMTLLLIANAGIVVSEFVGVAASLELFGISKYISIPIVTFGIWWLITKGSYPKIEKIFLFMSAILISYVITVFIIKPDFLKISKYLVIPHINLNNDYLFMVVALVGTTIAPFMQIFAQSSVVEKGITMSDYKYSRIDTFIGTIFANLIAVFIIVSTATTLHPLGIQIESASDAAKALTPLAGNFATFLFGIGLLGASLLSAGVVPLTTAFAIANAFGWESGINRSLDEAPVFYAIFTFLLVLAATITLSPAVSFIKLLLGFQVLNGLLLPIQLYYMMKLTNNRIVMGKHTNSKIFNYFAWLITFAISLAAISYLIIYAIKTIRLFIG